MEEMIKNQNDEDITQKVTEESIEETAKKVAGVACGVLCISFLGCLFFSLALMFIFFRSARSDFFFYGAMLTYILFLISSIVYGVCERSLGSE